MIADYDTLSMTFKALAHPVRLQILDMLRRGELCVCHIENALEQRQAYVSQQLMMLREAGLVESRKEGLRVYYRLTDDRIAALLDVICGEAGEQGHAVLPDCPCPHCDS